MPFKSKSQQKWMFYKHPKMAKRWAAHTPNMMDLPEKKHKDPLKMIRAVHKKLNKRGK